MRPLGEAKPRKLIEECPGTICKVNVAWERDSEGLWNDQAGLRHPKTHLILAHNAPVPEPAEGTTATGEAESGSFLVHFKSIFGSLSKGYKHERK